MTSEDEGTSLTEIKKSLNPETQAGVLNTEGVICVLFLSFQSLQ